MFYGASTLRNLPSQEPAVIWTKAEGALDPIVLDTLKTWIHRPLEDDFWNAEAQSLIKVAQRAIEKRCWLSLADTVWTGKAASFPTQLMCRPFLDVQKVEYVDSSSGEIIEIAPSLYVGAPALQQTGQLLPADGVDWPTVAVRPDAVRLTVRTSFGEALDEDLVHAVLMTVAALDTNRGDGGGGGGSRLDNTVWGQTNGSGPAIIPKAAMALLAPYMYRSVLTV